MDADQKGVGITGHVSQNTSTLPFISISITARQAGKLKAANIELWQSFCRLHCERAVADTKIVQVGALNRDY